MPRSLRPPSSPTSTSRLPASRTSDSSFQSPWRHGPPIHQLPQWHDLVLLTLKCYAIDSHVLSYIVYASTAIWQRISLYCLGSSTPSPSSYKTWFASVVAQPEMPSSPSRTTFWAITRLSSFTSMSFSAPSSKAISQLATTTAR